MSRMGDRGSLKRHFFTRVTIGITPVAFLEEYKAYQGPRLSCDREGNMNWPLALSKTRASVELERFSEFDHPLLRMHEQGLATKPVLDTYAFRVNETSRFVIEAGMHFSQTAIMVTLEDLGGNAFEFIGQ